MNWDDFRFFLALARHHTVSAAGRELKVKHTTVARRIASFEERMGTRLFDHVSDGYVMTQAGENLYEHAQVIEEQAQAVDRRVFGLDTQLQGVINLTGSYDVLSRLVIPQLRLFKKAYPCIDINLLGSSGLMDLSMREADIALRLTPKPPEHLIGKQIFGLHHGIYASTTYLKKQHSTDQLVLWRGNDDMPEWVSDHYPQAQTSVRVDDITSMLTAVKHHLGLARMPCYIGDAEPSLRRLDLKLTPSTWGVWVLSHVDLRSTARVRVTREFLIDTLEQQRELVEGTRSRYY